MLHSDGLIDGIMYNIYERYFSVYEGNFTLDGIIYIHADADVCFERIIKRSRSGESNISLDYLKKCQCYHTTWLTNEKIPVLTLDVNANVNVSVSDDINLQLWLNKAVQFIEMLSKYQVNPDTEELSLSA